MRSGKVRGKELHRRYPILKSLVPLSTVTFLDFTTSLNTLEKEELLQAPVKKDEVIVILGENSSQPCILREGQQRVAEALRANKVKVATVFRIVNGGEVVMMYHVRGAV